MDYIITEMVCVHIHKQTCNYLCNYVQVVIDKEKDLILVEISKGVTIDDIKQATGCPFELSYY